MLSDTLKLVENLLKPIQINKISHLSLYPLSLIYIDSITGYLHSADTRQLKQKQP